MFLFFSAAAFVCPDADDALEEAEAALLEVEEPRLAAAIARMEEALGCAAVTPEQLGRMWMVEGAFATVAGETDRALQAFAALRRTAPDAWSDQFGPDVLAAWEASAAQDGLEARVEIQPDLPDLAVRVDGRPTPALGPLPAGLHALQVMRDGKVVWGALVVLAPGSKSTVSTGLTRQEPPPPIEAPPRPPQKRSPALLIASAVVATAGTALAGVAVSQNRHLRERVDVDTVERARDVQVGTGIAAYSAWGLGAVGASVYLVTR